MKKVILLLSIVVVYMFIMIMTQSFLTREADEVSKNATNQTLSSRFNPNPPVPGGP